MVETTAARIDFSRLFSLINVGRLIANNREELEAGLTELIVSNAPALAHAAVEGLVMVTSRDEAPKP